MSEIIKLHNANIFSNGITANGTLIIKNGKIIHIIPDTSQQSYQTPQKITKSINCQGNLLLPGFIDVHVHLRDFKQKNKETIISGTKGALIGGTTTILAMPNTNPIINSIERVKKYKNQINVAERTEKKEKKENGFPYCNVGFNISILEDFNPNESHKFSNNSVFGIKVFPKNSSKNIPLEWDMAWKNDVGYQYFINYFLGKNGGELLIYSEEKILENFQGWKKLFQLGERTKLPIIFHPELITSKETIGNSIGKEEYKDNINNVQLRQFEQSHPIIHNERAHIQMIALMLKAFYPEPDKAPRVHFCHLTSSECAIMINNCLKQNGYSSSYEFTPHHLFLNLNSKFRHESLGKVLTPIRTELEQNKTLELFKEGMVDIIATDHAPHTLEEKMDHGFGHAPPGLPYIDFAPRILLSEVFNFRFPLDLLIKKYTIEPAKLFNIKNKGEIRLGYDADLILVEKVEPYPIRGINMESKQKWTPFEDMEICAKISKVFLQGKLAYDSDLNIIKASGEFL